MLTEFNWIDAVSASPAFIALIICSAVTLGIAAERAYYYWKRSGDPDNTLAETIKRLRTGDSQGAFYTCKSARHPMGAAACEVLRRFSDLGQTLGQTIEEQLHVPLSQQRLLLERNLNVLGTMAATAPLIGLLGTVWGIMRAFHDMANTGSAAPSVVAGGVAEALVTTGAGLVVAIPALMLYNHFSRRMNVMLTVAENHARSLRSFLESRAKGGPPGGGLATSEPEYAASAPGEINLEPQLEPQHAASG
jgi:biopolymer transport protein ExbB